ncbi:hypothetical protein JYP52_03945 [Nitratireductor aquibiodomus]|uniref:hypothetical protein n=1 Tax=Nitratireductor aquibiodomus TaxID=204799 RepID=UPI0019D37351|nr:hypothetical protein [Nitratireductor aquibiodomus]MBN7760275.1 hypothetical protein [Nitratireductor aquibiodomus]
MSNSSVRYEGGRLVIEADTFWMEGEKPPAVESGPSRNKALFVGVHFNLRGERVIEYGGETICTVAEMREMLKSCDDDAGLQEWVENHRRARKRGMI